MLNKAVCTKARVQVKNKQTNKTTTSGQRKEYITSVHQTLFSAFMIPPFRKCPLHLQWGRTDANENTLDKLLPFSLCLIKTQHSFTGTHQAAHTPASLSKNHHKLEISTFVIVFNGSVNRGREMNRWTQTAAVSFTATLLRSLIAASGCCFKCNL